MIVSNTTTFDVVALLQSSVADFPTDGLTVEVKYCPSNSRRYASGTYYRRTRNYENGKLIRVRINRKNRYPISIRFKTSEYFKKRNRKGEDMVYQKLRSVKFQKAEDVILGIFLHEFSHYMDHMEGRNGRYKQTKADKFAVSILEQMGVIETVRPS